MYADFLQELQHVNTTVPLKVTRHGWFTKHVDTLRCPNTSINRSPFEEILNARRKVGHIILHLLSICMIAFYSPS